MLEMRPNAGKGLFIKFVCVCVHLHNADPSTTENCLTNKKRCSSQCLSEMIVEHNQIWTQ